MLFPDGYEHWQVTKTAAASRGGVVASQHALASAAGLSLLEAGGNAADAAVATAFALGVVEPWMSGIGGGGFLLYAHARSTSVELVDFAMVAPSALDPARYALTGEPGNDPFGWPRVIGDRNTKGSEAICVPGAVDGLALALERFGRKSLAEVVGPALALAELGLAVDWPTTLAIAIAAPDLADCAASRAVFLPRGLPPVSPAEGPPLRLPLPALAATYRRLAAAGPRDFYEGELAADIVADLAELGSPLAAGDLARYRARASAPTEGAYRDVAVYGASALSGAPTALAALEELDRALPKTLLGAPDAGVFLAYAEALRGAFAKRLQRLGHDAPASQTTHVSVVDRDGNMASLTNTLLARFGAKVTLPRTGIVMNNGMMWFDPVPGRPNSIAPGKRPLANMCPLILGRDGRPWAALGACGGRRIISAVVQLVSFLVDFGMPLEKAMATPRLDASGERLVLDRRLPAEIRDALAARLPTVAVADGVYPTHFAVPSAVLHAASGVKTGMAHIHAPLAAALAEA